MDLWLQAVALILQPQHLLMLIGSVLAGILVGAAPGLTPTMAIGLLVPLTFTLSQYMAFIMMCGIYVGGLYGGGITAILLNVPGTPSAAVTAIDGYPMTLKGEGGTALGMAVMASSIGGLISCAFLLFLSLKLATLAILFSGPEYFSLGLFAIAVVFSLAGKSVVKGLISACFGLLLSTLGVDRVAPFPRFTFGIQELTIGIPDVPAIIGLFCVSEAFRMAEESEIVAKVQQKVSGMLLAYRLLPKLWKTILKSSLIGTAIGILPATGALMAAFLAYGEARRSSKHPETFGKGEVEGVCAAQAADNAVTGGALIPMLTLGIPGDTNTLMMMGAMLVKGLVPGPTLFRDQTLLVYVIFVTMILSNLLILPFGLSCSTYIAKCVVVKKKYLMPIVAVLAITGASIGYGEVYYVWVAIVFGIFGYVCDKAGFSTLAIAMALILGPIIEVNLRSSLMLPDAGIMMFLTRPISLLFIVMAVLTVVFGVRREARIRAAKANRAAHA